MTITNPNDWTLFLLVESGSISYLLSSAGQVPIVGEIELSGIDETGKLKALENAVYDNSFLLDDYRRVTVIMRSRLFTILPPQYSEFTDRACEAHRSASVTTGNYIAATFYDKANVTITWEAEKGVVNFLQRTFNTPPVYHHLHPIIGYCRELNRTAQAGRLYLNFHTPEMMDIVAFGNNDKLLMANTISPRSTADAAYFALAAWKSCGLNTNDDNELVILGKNESGAAVSQVVRDYISRVVPAMPPAKIMKHGTEIAQAPLELLSLLLDTE